MESAAIALLLLLLLNVATSGSQKTCEPQDVQDSHKWISVAPGVSPGCWTHYTREGGEVHVLNLEFNPKINSELNFLSLNLTAAKPGHVIVNSNAIMPFAVTLQENNDVKVWIKKDFLSKNQPKYKTVTLTELPSDREELLAWATTEFGGVTSFTTIQDPMLIVFTGQQAEEVGSSDCTLDSEFSPKVYMLKVSPTLPLVQKSCSTHLPQSKKEFHIVNIPDEAETRRISVHIESEKEINLLLRGLKVQRGRYPDPSTSGLCRTTRSSWVAK
ncbi:hypothetical protein AAFF_G00253490 [Aldrovandia affinis]|uniref:TGFBR3/Endoglin-like N-terminal domain-containing protein n=1 Tax=Aldrovandia affinis TaxID=143900 RepID=A0AAD7STT9_9TELE|nr:hypothetical protein AAFF_G00253490 [Aldrovandia affinis]